MTNGKSKKKNFIPSFLPEQCKGYGARGSDTNYCESRGGGWNCDHCKNYYNIKTDYCPVMCGYCDRKYEWRLQCNRFRAKHKLRVVKGNIKTELEAREEKATHVQYYVKKILSEKLAATLQHFHPLQNYFKSIFDSHTGF